MKRACIVVVDAARARVYAYDEAANPGAELVELRDLVNAGRRMKASEMFSESRPGLASAGGRRVGGQRSESGEPGSAYDDHRDAHIDEMDARFAKLIVEETDTVIRDQKLGHLVLVAAPKMLGTLRKYNGVLHRPGLVTDEVSNDLTNLGAAQLHDQLASQHVIPPRQRLKMAR